MNLIAPQLTNTKVILMAWRITGGWRAVWRSADFILALTVWLFCLPFWLVGQWWEQVISVLPNLLGFTLGGFAIFLGFGSESFKTMLSDPDENKSPYISVSAAFLMFIFFQLIALLYAFSAKALHFDPTKIAEFLQIWISREFEVPSDFKERFFAGANLFYEGLKYADYAASGVGYFLFVYSLIFSLRASMRIFRLSRWYHHLIVLEAQEAARQAALRAVPPVPPAGPPGP